MKHYLPLVILIIVSCSKDETVQPQSNLPNNIVALTRINNGGDVMLNIDPRSESISSYRLFDDLGITGNYDFSVNEESHQIDFILFGSSGIDQKVEVLTYDSRMDRASKETLNVNNDAYYWLSGISSNNHIVLRGNSFENSGDSFISIIDKSSNTSEILKICDECIWFGAYSPLLIKNNLLFTFYESNISRRYFLVTVDLNSKNVLYTSELTSYPEILIGKSNLYLHSSNSQMEIYNQVSFEKIGSFEFPNFDIDLGINAAIDDKAIVYQGVAQPAPISRVPSIYNLSSGDLIHEFLLEDLISSTQKFENSTGYKLSTTPSLTFIDINQDFSLYQISQVNEDGFTSDYSYVYSNYVGDYIDHIDLPYIPKTILLVDWN